MGPLGGIDRREVLFVSYGGFGPGELRGFGGFGDRGL